MTLGKTIQIFLPDGNPRSIKIAEITSRTIQAVLVPRSKLDYVSTRNELKNVGIYFLVGQRDNGAKPMVYVGEAENCLNRVKQHNRSKDFWTHTIVLCSKTKYFTKTHVKFLEWFCHKEIQSVSRFRLDNSSIPARPHISEPLEADMADNFATFRTLTSTLGYPFFDKFERPKTKDILRCKGKQAQAEGEYSEDGLVVFKGSKCNLDVTESVGEWVINLRRKLQEDGTLVEQNKVLVFSNDHGFASPSAAAAVVLGRSANGWTAWKYKNGNTLDEIKRPRSD